MNEGKSAKVIYSWKIAKNGNIGKRVILDEIKSCGDCQWKIVWICGIEKKRVNDDNSIPGWCPLEDYKDDTISK